MLLTHFNPLKEECHSLPPEEMQTLSLICHYDPGQGTCRIGLQGNVLIQIQLKFISMKIKLNTNEPSDNTVSESDANQYREFNHEN